MTLTEMQDAYERHQDRVLDRHMGDDEPEEEDAELPDPPDWRDEEF